MKPEPAKRSLLACALTLPLAFAAHADLGSDTAKAMQASYDATPQNCDGRPAYGCSGTLLRVTKPSDKYFTWNNNPKAVEKGGISFSYMRADAPITALAESARSGYTLAPVLQRPAGTMKYRPLCAYPTDGDTWTRDKAGCGDNSLTPAIKENRCDKLGIHTAEQWVSHYRNSPQPFAPDAWQGNKDQRFIAQCGFDVRDKVEMPGAENFYQALRVMQLMNDRPFAWNEIIVAAWDESRFKELPIQSFFYIKGNAGGREDAQHVQRQWHQQTGKFIPVIQIQLPDAGSKARFDYHRDDQAIIANG
ncbi:hypothetical protein PMM47T1_17620 [Pseudomonas sp. M47T1]|uniref:hypothetical protein n=1 Tax=Pseudomonas sp. M47T1 TaxID=1179778 RepID=UPI00026067D5|nr:hypothetical protein [Pseudomonas sp. M47T1]EIK95337.1 hypothetical protein PMM47T1_17620 [Pseudomonas sp. M47T1]